MSDLQTSQPSAGPPRRRLLHPVSGLIILGLDWLLFGSNLLSGGLLILLWSAIGFLVGGLAVTLIQKRLQQDSTKVSLLKGLLAGIAVGIPFPIAGTALGALVLTLSGLDLLKQSK